MSNRVKFFASILTLAGLTCLATDRPAAGQSNEDDRRRMTGDLIESHTLAPLARGLTTYMALINEGNFDQAGKMFSISSSIKDDLKSGRVGKLIGRINLKPPARLAMMSFDFLSPDVISVVFVATDKDGPIAVKFGIYVHDHDNHIGKIDATDDWDRMQQWAAAGTRLPNPYTIELSPRTDTPK